MRIFKKLFVYFILLLVAIKCATAVCFYHYNTASTISEPRMIVIKKGSGFMDISQQLEDEGIVKNKFYFAAPAFVLGKHRLFKAGEYEIPAFSSPEHIIEQLANGDVVVHKLTFPEGYNVRQIVELINNEPSLTGEISQVPAEGTLMPNTYQFERGENRKSIISRMEKAMEKAIIELWNSRQDGLPFETPEEAVTLASIVEKEARLAEERTHIASVYINRLRNGMKLQADPTTIYAIELKQGKPMDRLLLRGDLKRNLPHNTYMHAGLPPTPIANPGRASLKATLNPKETDDIFFVARGDGGHYFAKTYAEHKRNIVKYKKAQREN